MRAYRSFALLIFVTLFGTFAGQTKAESTSRYIRKLDNNSPVIVFVHGVVGDSRSTWTAGDFYWPEALTKDAAFDGTSIYVYQYPTSLLGGSFSISELAENMRQHFDGDGVSAHKEIIFLAHSMGGLVTRAYLLNHREMAPKTRFLYFYSTPTTGSEIAALATLISSNPQFAKMKPMQSADYVADLQRSWLDADFFNIPAYCAYEKQATSGVLIVTQASASNLCNRRLDPIDATHITIVKPKDKDDVPYIVFKAAFQQTLPRIELAYKNDCMAENHQISMKDGSVRTEAGICKSKDDASKALRIRYLWLDSTSISLLMGNQIVGELEKAIGSKPYLSRNKVSDEVAALIRMFGAKRAAAKGSFVITGASVTAGEENDSQSSRDINFKESTTVRAQASTAIKIYDAEELTTIPDIEFYKAMKRANLPADYSVFYSENLSDPKDTSALLNSITLWRYIRPDDVQTYDKQVLALRDMLLADDTEVFLGPRQLQDQFYKKGSRIDVPNSIAAIKYFTRAGWPEGFAVASGNIGCGDDRPQTLSFLPRVLYVQVAVIENLSSVPLALSSFKVDEIISDRLRLEDQDGKWTPASLAFPVGTLAHDETLVIPLHIQLRSEGNDPGIDENGSLQAFNKIKTDPRTVFVVKDAKGRVIRSVNKSSLRPPSFPVLERNFTYGPRMRLVAAISQDREIPLRQFDPAKVWVHFGNMEGSCPSVYVKEDSEGSRVSYGRVLGGASLVNRVRTDTLIFDGPMDSIELTEEQPEVTFVKSLKLIAIDENGIESLAYSARERLIIPGHQLKIETPSLKSAAKIKMEIEGYYRSIPSILHESRAPE